MAKTLKELDLIENFKQNFSEFFCWLYSTIFKSDIFRYIKVSYIYEDEDNIYNSRISFSSNTYEYNVSAIKASEGLSTGLLSASVNNRKLRPGHNLIDILDIYEGNYSFDDWTKIIGKVFSCEMEKLSKQNIDKFNIFKRKFPQFIKWVERTIKPKDFESYFKINDIRKQFSDNLEDEQIIGSLSIYTCTNEYHIALYYPCESIPEGSIVVITNPRKTDAGDDFIYQNDIIDGNYSLNTWYDIIKHILSFELVKIE